MSKLYDYLFLQKECPFKNKWFNSIVINSKEKIYLKDIMEELLGKVEITDFDNSTIICYFEDLDFKVSDVVMSLSDDLGIAFSAYKLPKLYTKENRFLALYNIYNKYLPNMNGFFSTSDLINEAVSKDIEDAKELKKMILSKVLDDPMNEVLIRGMFDNDLNVLKTSKSIYMHRNTVNNKIAYIEKETNLNITKFKDAVSMYILLNVK